VKFQLIDTILEQSPQRVVALKQVSLAEEYLADHFPSFAVLPGVLMIEAMVQAARAMLSGRDSSTGHLVLGEVRALKFGQLVRPGEALEVEVTLHQSLDDGTFVCKGNGRVRRQAQAMTHGDFSAGQTAVSGRFTMRPLRN
jgi:3-hydroxyacyl-[acyl-carrier-protein] dehydratase